MLKSTKEIYNKIVEMKTGQEIITRDKRGCEHRYELLDALTQQGYKKDIDFSIVYSKNSYNSFIKKLKDITPYIEPKHDIKIGDIFYNTWGYDQSNIDFYQVVSTTEKTITIRPIKDSATKFNNHQLTGKKVALKDKFSSDEKIRKTPYLMSGEWRINFEYGAGCQWNGEPINYSCYA